LDQRLSTIPQHTWVSKLFGYDFQVVFQPGKHNMAADALSRREEETTTVHAISVTTFQLFEAFREEAQHLSEVQEKREQIQKGVAAEWWSLVDDFVMYQGKNFMLASSRWWPIVLAEAHGTGHEGAEKTLFSLWASFYTPAAARLVKEFIQGCEVCQKNKTDHLHSAGLLQPLHVPSSVWSDIAMDFVEGFSWVTGKSVVLTVLDRFSKYDHFVALGHPYTVASVVKVFFWFHC
jgi:hypothetical protein